MVRSPCCEDTSELTKGPWSKQEDKKLIKFIRKNGHENWRALPKKAGLNRCGKSCRLRWKNYLRPNIKRGNFSDEEELLIIKLHSELGSKWSRIATHLPGRTDNEIKNHWNTRMRKKLNRNNDVDLNTHPLLLDPNLLTNLSLLNLITYSNWNNALYPTNNLQLPQNPMQMLNQNGFDATNFPLRNAFDPANQLQQSQNLMEVINPNFFPNLFNSFGGTSYPQQEPFHEINNMVKNQLLFNTVPSVSNPMTSFDYEFQGKLSNLFSNNNLNTDYISETENSLPSLISVETPTLVNQIENNFPPVYSPSSILFEDLDMFWGDKAI